MGGRGRGGGERWLCLVTTGTEDWTRHPRSPCPISVPPPTPRHSTMLSMASCRCFFLVHPSTSRSVSEQIMDHVRWTLDQWRDYVRGWISLWLPSSVCSPGKGAAVPLACSWSARDHRKTSLLGSFHFAGCFERPSISGSQLTPGAITVPVLVRDTNATLWLRET